VRNGGLRAGRADAPWDAPKRRWRSKILHPDFSRIPAPESRFDTAIFDEPLCLWMEVE